MDERSEEQRQCEPNGSVKWISRENDIATATDQELQRSLLTSDGMGRGFKARCLAELLMRAKSQNMVISETATNHGGANDAD